MRKGTVVVIDYTIYASKEITDSWKELDDSFDTSGLPVVDHRKSFKICVGCGDIDPQLEKYILRRPISLSQRGDQIYAVQVIQGTVHMTPDDIFVELLRVKSEGNELVKNSDFQAAHELYSEGIRLLEEGFDRRSEDDINQAVVPLFLNRALCSLKMSLFQECIQSCDKVLVLDKSNVKAFYRRALARIQNRDFGNAKRDLLSVLFIEPNNVDAKAKLAELEAVKESLIVLPAISTTTGTRIRIHVRIGEEKSGSTGVITCGLYDATVPRTVGNFKDLIPKYKNMHVFKVVKDQFFQSGDYEYNDGSGGNAAVSDTCVRSRNFMNDESLTGSNDRRGILGMSNYGPNTNTSQFYVTLASCSHIDGKHVVFGEVTDGWDVLDNINSAADPCVFESRPRKPIFITEIVVD